MNFRLTKSKSIVLSNEQIIFIRENSRAKIMKKLNVIESHARKMKDAIKSGALYEENVMFYQRKERLKNKAKETYGNGRYAERIAPSGKTIASRYKPSKVAADIYARTNNKDDFEILASNYVSAATASTWYCHCVNWFGVK